MDILLYRARSYVIFLVSMIYSLPKKKCDVFKLISAEIAKLLKNCLYLQKANLIWEFFCKCSFYLNKNLQCTITYILLFLLQDYHSCTTLRPATQSDYQYWHERDWIIMVEWAKTIPIYESLPIGDKLALLRHSAITYPSLLQCFYSPDRGPDTIVFPNGAFFDRTIEPSR
uniref:NR LBD domain-containing protein n=1 Tax=Ascaris lumbricoides TaxID=6252 RepID=A0A0M3HGG3_ASCLU